MEIPVYVDRDRSTKKAVGVELAAFDEHPDQHRFEVVDKVSDIGSVRQQA